ncbi:achaete-scute complex protein T3 [Parasteatoda tepidariorum]|uniref:achaete-scute complex protein T3 n=1 Tax=Parasteatoda tepidariorum TaxID=114398 RepID=UPI00077FDC0F|nr:achaete-scute complex protein T3 [Parasteatoda tepidariorum]
MVQEMTQFSTHSFSYDSHYALPHLKSELSQVWNNTSHLLQGVLDDSPFSDAAVPESTSSALTTDGPPAPKKKSKRSGNKSSYKHVPHREKPPHLVARRNARERRRVQAVNTAFSRLRKCVPTESKSKRLSKVKTLHRAIEYIQMLQEMLTKADEDIGNDELSLRAAVQADSLNKENELHQRWLQLPSSWDDTNQNSCLSFYDDFSDALQS